MQSLDYFDKKIIVVDHNPHFIKSMKILFQQNGYTNVTGFEDTKDAQSYITACHDEVYKTYINLMLFPVQGTELLKNLMDKNLSPIGFTMMTDYVSNPQLAINHTHADISHPIVKPYFLATDVEVFKKSMQLEMAYIDLRKKSVAPDADNDTEVSEAYKLRELAVALAMQIPITNIPPSKLESMSEAAVAGTSSMILYDILKSQCPDLLPEAWPEIASGIAELSKLVV